jgi:tetraacyldisaccharide 4'-kinase
MQPERVHQILSGSATDSQARLMRLALACVEPVYRAAIELRNRRYDLGRGVAFAECPVVSVGNITTGGTGKTPMVAWLCNTLHRAGFSPAVLTRGYKGHGDTSDEIELLRTLVGPGVPIVKNADRVRGASRVAKEHPKVNLLVLDDGFQHRRIHREVDLVLIDASAPFGFDRLLPRGLLREPLASLRRAHAVVLTRTDAVARDAAEEIERRVRSLAPGRPVLHARLDVSKVAWESHENPPAWLAGRTVLAFCGIGNPKSFFALLERAGARVAEHVAFADHHAFSADEIETLVRRGLEVGATPVTTTKDAVRLTPAQRSRVAVVHTRLALHDGQPAELLRLITERVSDRTKEKRLHGGG